jgi:hypothetical protein
VDGHGYLKGAGRFETFGCGFGEMKKLFQAFDLLAASQ